MRRLELAGTLTRRLIEEEVAAVVPQMNLGLKPSNNSFVAIRALADVLEQHGWKPGRSHLASLASRKHSNALVSTLRGREEDFFAMEPGSDQVVYSLIRTRDRGLARELWIRAEEKSLIFLNWPASTEKVLRLGTWG